MTLNMHYFIGLMEVKNNFKKQWIWVFLFHMVLL